MQNENIRKAAKTAGVHLWEIAAKLGISEPTLTRWLRFPLTTEKETKVLDAIAELMQETVRNG